MLSSFYHEIEGSQECGSSTLGGPSGMQILSREHCSESTLAALEMGHITPQFIMM